MRARGVAMQRASVGPARDGTRDRPADPLRIALGRTRAGCSSDRQVSPSTGDAFGLVPRRRDRHRRLLRSTSPPRRGPRRARLRTGRDDAGCRTPRRGDRGGSVRLAGSVRAVCRRTCKLEVRPTLDALAPDTVVDAAPADLLVADGSPSCVLLGGSRPSPAGWRRGLRDGDPLGSWIGSESRVVCRPGPRSR